MKEITSQEQKELCIRMLKVFAKFCDNYNLTYFLYGGTMLGAIRHHGMIPWDDDIDVLMPRDDYEKFIKSFNKNTEDLNIKFICIENDIDYPFPYGKLCVKDTVIYYGDERRKYGVFIDVFVMDGVGNDYNKGKKIKKKLVNYVANGYSPYKNKLLSKFWHKYCNLKEYGYEKTLHLNRCKRYSIDASKYSMVSSSPKPYIFKSMVFGERERFLFEGEYYYGPKHYDEFLKLWYGDYMELPPVEKRYGPCKNYKFYWENKD